MKSLSSILYFNSAERRSWILLVSFIIILLSIQFYIKRHTSPKPIDFSKHEDLFYEYHESVNQDIFKVEEEKSLIDKKEHNTNGENERNHLTFNKKKNPNYFEVENEDSPQASDVTYLIIDTIHQTSENFNSIKKEKDLLVTHISEKEENIKISSKFNSTILIDINTADEIQLQYIKGIGPTFASRITKYRELIGGFYNINQLMEVYGIDREKYLQLKDQIKLTGATKKININSLDYNDISSHPYITYQEAKLIVAYRKKHGAYKNVYDITKIGVMDSSFVNKILPYIADSLKSYNAQAPLTSL